MSLYARIEAAAGQVKPRVVVQTALVALPYAVGWVLGMVARLLWGVGVRLWAALRIGLSDGWGARQ